MAIPRGAGGDGADPGQERSQATQVSDSPPELALDQHPLTLRDGSTKIAIVLRQALDGQVSGGHQVTLLGALLGGVNQQRDFSNFLGQIVHG